MQLACQTAEEEWIIKIVHSQNFMSKGAQVNQRKNIGEHGYQRIRLAQCRGERTGKKAGKQTCELEFVWVRGNGKLALYAMVSKSRSNMNDILWLNHEFCTRSESRFNGPSISRKKECREKNNCRDARLYSNKYGCEM